MLKGCSDFFSSVKFICACDFSCNFNETCSLVFLQNKDDHLNEFLSSLGDPSSPVIEDFDFTSGKNEVLFFS